MSDSNSYGVTWLLDYLKGRGLSTAEEKVMHFIHLMESNPSREQDAEDVGEGHFRDASREDKREKEVLQCEKNIDERDNLELERVRNEISLLREYQNMHSVDHEHREGTLATA
ncbi:hypothetical protein X777_16453 [Ooceraea biroi]|uniref:Uncharacterized protein n=1 Tax=Ooceraea biroi TaxID=2015173 RepID=A0A026VUM1_OOCBI|nr:hypothetical protein X777_16453 [Ooceraea biroi]